MGSRLEVGTGYHPDLTRRENIFLNGAILGMTKKQIETRFDNIVKFVEVEKFLDTPIKRFSSGMYLRLAFAVAAHLSLRGLDKLGARPGAQVPLTSYTTIIWDWI